MKSIRGLLTVWTVAVLVFLYAPIFILIAYSFNSSRLNILWEGFTLRWYSAIWQDAVLVRSLQNSLIVAAASTVLSVVLGTGGGWLLYRYRFPAVKLIDTLVFVPMIIPEVVMGVSLLILFVVIGLDLGYWTIIISHVTFCFPFVLVAVQARLAGLDPALEEAAMDLGATPARAFLGVIVPYLAPAIISGAHVVHAVVRELIVTYFTASAGTRTLPLEIFGRVKKGLDPTLNAISTVFILATVVLVVATELLNRRARKVAS